nr:hypothetical protein [Tanacetum cinerariifolium]
RNLPDPGELISILNSGIRENPSSTTRVNLPVEDDHSTLLAYVVKDKQEKDKIRTKPDKNEKRGKARQCRRPITVKKAGKEKKIQVQGTKLAILKSCIDSSQWFWGFEVKVVGCSREQWEWRETGGLGFTGVGGKSVVSEQWMHSNLNRE